MVAVKFMRLDPDAQIPVYKTRGSAGADIRSTQKITLSPGDVKAIPTGFAVGIPEGFELQIRPRSGLALQNKIGVLNSPGTIDSDYRGEVMVILQNCGNSDFEISPGDRIAQGVICRVPQATYIEVSSLESTLRGAGGFGSTGKD